jgi:uncharacterized membrane protein (DUF106 family)
MQFPPETIPYSTIFMFLLAFTISLLTTLANRLLTNPEKSKEWRKEIAEWNTDLRKAQRGGDKKTVDKLMKRQKEVFQLQSKMMWQSMKVTLLFLVPLILIWQFLGGFYTKPGVPPDIPSQPIAVAYFPGIGPILPLPIFNISLIWWYLFCSMLFGMIFSHVFGITEVSK